LINGRASPAAAAFTETLRLIDHSHRNPGPLVPSKLKKRLVSILRNEVPEQEQKFAMRVGLLVWEALMPTPFILSEEQFAERILEKIRDPLNILIGRFVGLHHQVVDLVYVRRAINGDLARTGEPFDEEKLWRNRNPDIDDDSLREAASLIVEAAMRGIHQTIRSYRRTSWMERGVEIIAQGVLRGRLAHGAYDVGAFHSGGTLAMAQGAVSHSGERTEIVTVQIAPRLQKPKRVRVKSMGKTREVYPARLDVPVDRPATAHGIIEAFRAKQKVGNVPLYLLADGKYLFSTLPPGVKRIYITDVAPTWKAKYWPIATRFIALTIASGLAAFHLQGGARPSGPHGATPLAHSAA
jgi:hypothetical protein